MKHTTRRSARRRALIALSDYRTFSTIELVEQAAELHDDLRRVEGDGFSLSATLGLRHLIVERLLQIDQEHRRRQDQSLPTAA